MGAEKLDCDRMYSFLYPIYKLILYSNGDKSDGAWGQLITRWRISPDLTKKPGYVTMVNALLNKKPEMGVMTDLYGFHIGADTSNDVLYVMVRDCADSTIWNLTFFEFNGVYVVVLPQHVLYSTDISVTTKWLANLVTIAFKYGCSRSLYNNVNYYTDAEMLTLYISDLFFLHSLIEYEMGEIGKYISDIISVGHIKLFNRIEDILDECELLKSSSLSMSFTNYLDAFVNSRSPLWYEFTKDDVIMSFMHLNNI